MNKLISIVIPIYNSEKYLKKTLDSILKQDYPYFEVIMVNDGSTDNSESICKKNLMDKRFKYHYIKNSGVSNARNYGIKNAKGDYICFVDSDDILSEKYLKTLIELYSPNNNFLACCMYDTFSSKSENMIHKENIGELTEKKMSNNKKYEIIYSEFGGYIWNKLFDLKIIKKYKIEFSNKIFMCEDMLFLYKYLSHVDGVIGTNSNCYHYRLLNDSICHKLKNFKWFTIFEVYDYIFSDNKIFSKKFNDNLNYVYKYKLCEGKFRLKFNKDSTKYKEYKKKIKQKYHDNNAKLCISKKFKLFIYWNFNYIAFTLKFKEWRK